MTRGESEVRPLFFFVGGGGGLGREGLGCPVGFRIWILNPNEKCNPMYTSFIIYYIVTTVFERKHTVSTKKKAKKT